MSFRVTEERRLSIPGGLRLQRRRLLPIITGAAHCRSSAVVRSIAWCARKHSSPRAASAALRLGLRLEWFQQVHPPRNPVTSQSRRVLSALPDTRTLPSAEKATDIT